MAQRKTVNLKEGQIGIRVKGWGCEFDYGEQHFLWSRRYNKL